MSDFTISYIYFPHFSLILFFFNQICPFVDYPYIAFEFSRFTKLFTCETGVHDGVLLTGKGRMCLDDNRTQIDVLVCSVKEKSSGK